MATVPRKRTTIWLDVDEEGFADVHTEDDMVMVEAVSYNDEEIEVLICPKLFPVLRKVMDAAEGK